MLRTGEDGLKPAAFAYAKARSLDDAIALLSAHTGEAKLLAGGQSLIATLNMRLSSPSLLVDINGIGGIGGIGVTNGMVEIGALTRHVALERSSDIAKHAPLIAKAMPHIAHPAIRNRGTIGGSLAYADPAAELPACLVALDGEIGIIGTNGKRSVKAGDFFKGLFETALGPHDVLTAIRFAAADASTRVGFAELARRHGDYAMVGLAAVAKANGKALSDVRLVYFGVGATPVRARKAEAALAAGSVDDAVSALDLDPEDDIQATGAVKKHLAGVLLRRVAKQLMETA
ncbi:MAG: aerobic carbon-monoxide dehydrogenase medium subunit [Hyphomicrobiales bacterium]|jgi:carbon-monoxide dehydrogenase medium subunit|nr:aerobic carbon-monoxide dehydrogenase medium subunit [Hyphomicrobiales bacterium]